MFISGACLLQGEEILNQHMIIVWGSFLMSNRLQIPQQGQWREVRWTADVGQALDLKYFVLIFPQSTLKEKGYCSHFTMRKLRFRKAKQWLAQGDFWQRNGLSWELNEVHVLTHHTRLVQPEDLGIEWSQLPQSGIPRTPL